MSDLVSMTPPKSPQVLFILSAGHSGSTLLDFIAGSLDGVFSAGELTHLPHVLELEKQAGIRGRIELAELKRRQGGACTCQQTLRDCPIWSEVLGSLGDQIGVNLWNAPLALPTGIARCRHRSHWDKWDYLRHFAINRPLRAALFGSYGRPAIGRIADAVQRGWLDAPARLNKSLYEQISVASHCDVIVDSSKDLLRLMAVRKAMPEQARAVVLLRDLRGVVYSAYKRGLPFQHRARQWVRGYDRLIRILQGMPDCPRLVLRYEDFTKNPDSARQKLSAFVGLADSASNPTAPLQCSTLKTTDYHLVAGNPMRFEGEITIRPDTGWSEGLPREIADEYQQANDRIEQRLNSLSAATACA